MRLTGHISGRRSRWCLGRHTLDVVAWIVFGRHTDHAEIGSSVRYVAARFLVTRCAGLVASVGELNVQKVDCVKGHLRHNRPERVVNMLSVHNLPDSNR